MYSLPQHDLDPVRVGGILLARSHYQFAQFGGMPINASFALLDQAENSLWDASILNLLVKIRTNIEAVVRATGWRFSKPFPEFISADFAASIAALDMPRLSEYFIPDLGYALDGGRPLSLEDYRRVFQVLPLPDIASNYQTDERFAYSFVAGANPAVIRRLTAVPSHFPISNEQLQQLSDFASDDLQTAIVEGRVYCADFAMLKILADGQHHGQNKYVYQPLCAFAVPRQGGLMQPFAIQTSQYGADLYTPRDGWSWQIAKGMVMAAVTNHHEAVTHLGSTHLVIEPIIVCTYRNLATNHPIAALLTHHFEGTLQINDLAINWLLQPEKPFDMLTGATLDSVYALAAEGRLGFDFRANYLPTRLKEQGLTDTQALPLYPYRDDGLLIWQAIQDWMTDFVACYYATDADVIADFELQAWAREIDSPSGGRVHNFLGGQSGILSRADLAAMLTMILFTAGPQHAAVNFPQTEMAYTPAGPLAGFVPALSGKGHTEQDYLDFLPPVDVACTAAMVLDFLGEVYYDQLGNYGLIFAGEGSAVNEALRRFQTRLVGIEAMICKRDATRPYSYPHLKPSLIPQSINI